MMCLNFLRHIAPSSGLSYRPHPHHHHNIIHRHHHHHNDLLLYCLLLSVTSILAGLPPLLIPHDEEDLTDSSHNHEPLHFNEVKGLNNTSYYYANIFSPNFPSQFSTPFTKLYVINTTSLQGLVNPVVNIYLCEIFTSEDSFNIYDGVGMALVLTKEAKQIPIQLKDEEVIEVQIRLLNLHKQLRTKVHFHDIFGYNISIEVLDKGVVDLGQSQVEQGCSVRNCSYAGRCKAGLGGRRLEFRCECLEGYNGVNCEYGPECDPKRGINFCENGGTCRMYGYAGGKCDCPDGFGGSKCQLRKRERNFVEGNRDCSASNGFEVEDRPCSLCNKIPAQEKEDWDRFLVVVERGWGASIPTRIKNLSQLLSQMFQEGYLLGSQTGQVNRMIVEVFGQLLHNNNNSSSNNGTEIVDGWTFPPGVSIRKGDADSDQQNYESLQPIIWMNKEKEKPLLEEQEFSLTCQSRLPSASSLLQFRWFKDHVLIREEYKARHRHIEEIPLEQGDGSILMIYNVSPFDMGVFTCQVTDLVANVQECTDYKMLVVVPPQLEVMPMSVTIAKNESKILMCSDSLEALGSKSHDNLQITWYKDSELVRDNSLWSTETIYPQGTLLRLRHATTSATFTCKASNKGGVRERSVRVEVLQPWASPYDYCSQTCEMVEGTGSRLIWGLTAIHQTALIPCPSHFFGWAQRRCGSGGRNRQGRWEPSDFSRCTHEELGSFNYTLRSMQNGYNVRSEGLTYLPKQLNAYLDGRRGEGGNGRLLYGEGDKFIGMLEDTLHYVMQLNQTTPRLMQGGEVVKGLVKVVDNFMGFRNSCAHPASIDSLLKHFLFFVKEFQVENYTSGHIFVQRVLLPNSLSNETEMNNETLSSGIIEINGNSTSIRFDGNAILDEREVTRYLIYTQLHGLPHLNENISMISDVVRVELTPSLDETSSCWKEEDEGGGHFRLEFHALSTNTSKNKSCGGFYDSKWNKDVCLLSFNSTLFGGFGCLCKASGTYALLEFEEEIIIQPKAEELIEFPPEWIATSGCIVCLVLCCRTLIFGILRRVFLPYFLLVSIGLILSMGCLLHIILMTYSREVGVAYLTLTLALQSVRIWRLLCVGNTLHELYPWLDQVSPWVLLAVIAFTQVGPLFTVFCVDVAISGTKSVLDQHSAVFITFAILEAVSVLGVVILYYKRYLRFYRKSATNNNCQGTMRGDQCILNETFLQTLVHLVQILSLVLYVNLRRHTTTHVFLGVTTSLLGLAWRIPKISRHHTPHGNKTNRRNNNGEESLPTLPFNNGTITTSSSSSSHLNFNNVNRLGYKLELKPLREISSNTNNYNTNKTTLEEQEDIDQDQEDPMTNDTLDTEISVSTISHSGLAYLRPYSGALPKRVECQLSLEDNYVLPSPK